MKNHTKLSPEELLKAIQETPDEPPPDAEPTPEEDAEIARIVAMSPAELDLALEAEGYTKADLEAQANAILGPRIEAPAADPTPVRAIPVERPPARVIPFYRRVPVYIAAAATVAATSGGVVLMNLLESPLTLVASGHDAGLAPEVGARAVDLRRQATEALARREYRRVIELLDQAKAIDPRGDALEPAVTLRKEALAAIDGASE